MREIDEYLSQSYKRDVMGQTVEVKMPGASTLAEVEAMIKSIDALGLGAHLANRDFVSYQNRRALVKLRDVLRNEVEQRS